MMITMHLSPLLDAELRFARTGVATAHIFAAFHALIATQRVQPEPLFLDAQVVGFAPIWHVAVPDASADAVVEALRQTPGVEAAYGKPDDQLASPP